MSDLVKRLLAAIDNDVTPNWPLFRKAADELSRLRAENERLTDRCEAYKGQIFAGAQRIRELEGERDTATRALGQLRDIVSNDPKGPALRILVLIDAALSKTEGKG